MVLRLGLWDGRSTWSSKNKNMIMVLVVVAAMASTGWAEASVAETFTADDWLDCAFDAIMARRARRGDAKHPLSIFAVAFALSRAHAPDGETPLDLAALCELTGWKELYVWRSVCALQGLGLIAAFGGPSFTARGEIVSAGEARIEFRIPRGGDPEVRT